MKAGDTVSTGLGLGMGLTLISYMYQTMNTYCKTAKPVVICLKCQGRNTIENRYCWHCGSAIYPQSTTQCTKCKATVPSMKYCGNCGSKLKK
jgi:predicted amidophosphoribosyltransferase